MASWDLGGNAITGPTQYLGTQANNNPQPLAISTNGVERLRVDTNGNVGIGTQAPQSKLQISGLTAIDEGPTAAGAWTNLGSNSYYDGAWKRLDTTKPGVNLHMNADDGAGQEFRFHREEINSNARNLAVIGSQTSYISGGKVGIGTTNPTAALEVAASIQGLKVGVSGNMANANVEVVGDLEVIGHDASSVSTLGASAWNFYNSGNSPSWSGTLLRYYGQNTTGTVNALPTANQGAIVFQNLSNGVITSNGQTNIYIAPYEKVSAAFLWNGNVGVGESNPSYNLHVAGSDGTNIRVEGATSPRFSINQTAGQGDQKLWQNYAAKLNESISVLNFSALNDAENSENFWMNVCRGPGTAIQSVIFPNGNVGIGVTSQGVGVGGPPAPTVMTKLQIEGPSDPLASIGLTRSDNHKFMRLGVGASGVALDFDPSSYFVIQKNTSASMGGTFSGQELLRVTADGNVVVPGDILLTGADCAEHFDIGAGESPQPGTVVVIDEGGALRESREPYDKKVAGVVSGAGGYRHGLVLDKRSSDEGRIPVALVGKVYCKVDADNSPIQVGDLLTTSTTPGYAMKATERRKAFGSIIGKALRSLERGQGLIPILIALQ